MLHAGLAIELAKALEQERRRVVRPAPRGSVDDRGARRVGASTGTIEHLLSAVGAVSLLAIILLGPIGIVASVAIMVIIVTLGSRPPRPARPSAEEPAVAGPLGHEAADRWSAWRVVEPDPEYLRRRAA